MCSPCILRDAIIGQTHRSAPTPTGHPQGMPLHQQGTHKGCPYTLKIFNGEWNESQTKNQASEQKYSELIIERRTTRCGGRQERRLLRLEQVAQDNHCSTHRHRRLARSGELYVLNAWCYVHWIVYPSTEKPWSRPALPDADVASGRRFIYSIYNKVGNNEAVVQ